MKYFKHDLASRDDDKIFELVEVHGMQGYGIWWSLLEELYKAEEQGFQIEATDTWFKRLSKQLNLTDWRTLIRTLDTMAEQGLIDAQLWAEHVIYAPGMAKRADQYMQAKQAAAERKRRQRERDREALSRVTPVGQSHCHNTVTTNTDPDPDPNSDPEKDLERTPLTPQGGDSSGATEQDKVELPSLFSENEQPENLSTGSETYSCSAPPKKGKPDYQRWIETYLANKPKAWSGIEKIEGIPSREKCVARGLAAYGGNEDEAIKRLELALRYVKKVNEPFWIDKAHSFETILRRDTMHMIGWAEAAIESGLGCDPNHGEDFEARKARRKAEILAQARAEIGVA